MKTIDYQKLSYKEQLKRKQKYVQDLFQPLKLNFKIEEILKNGSPKHYRHKVTASATSVMINRKPKLRLGMFVENTHDIDPGFTHDIHDESINEVLSKIEQVLNKYKISAYHIRKQKGILKHVLIRKSFLTKEMLVVFVTNTKFFPNHKNIIKDIRKDFPQIKTVIQMIQEKHTPIVLYGEAHTLFGPGYIKDGFNDLVFRLSAKSFYQVNPMQMINLYQKALDMGDIKHSDTVMDCYSGIGTISLLASKQAKEVIAIEVNEQAVKDAKFNQKQNNITNVKFYCDDVEVFMKGFNQKVDVLILDPTRSGASKNFLEAVKKLKPKKIVYISCFVETQVRDLKLLQSMYKIKKIQPVDMFSFTKHVETITLLSLKTA